MKPVAALLASAALATGVAGCADDAGTLGPAATAPATPPASVARTTPAGPETAAPPRRYEAWLVRDANLYLVKRTGRAGVRAVARRALAALDAGPTPEEEKAGVSTLIAASDHPVVVQIEHAIATVAMGPGSPPGARARRLRTAQIVFTLTQFRDTIAGVRFASGTGAAAGPTLTRRSFDKLAPPIVVDDPRVGATTSSPLTISGTANVFEATVSIRILDAAGATIARTFTTATCGTGCRGDFTASVRYDVDTAQDGTVEVFEVSAKDGKPLHVVSVPVRLSPPRGVAP
jgi:hypothetical protein